MAAPPAAARDVSHALAPAYVWQLRVEHFGALQTAAEATVLGGLKRVPGLPFQVCTVRGGCLNYGKFTYDLPPGAPPQFCSRSRHICSPCSTMNHAGTAIEEVCIDPFAVSDLERNRAGWAIHITAPAPSSELPAPLPLRVHGLDKAARSELMALLRDERDTLDYLQRDPEAMGSTFARALVAALWRRFPARPALRAAYFSRWGRVVDGRDCGDAGPALFRALFAAFRALLSPESLEPPDPTALAGAAVARAHAGKPADAVPALAAAVDAFAAVLDPGGSAAGVLARLALLARPLAPHALAAWARTPVPGGHDFAKAVHCAEEAVLALRRAKPWALPLLAASAALPGDELFSAPARAWYEQHAARAAAGELPAPERDLDAWLDALGPRAPLRLAEAAAAAGDLPALEAMLRAMPRGGAEVYASLAHDDATFAAVPLLLPRPAADARAVVAMLIAPGTGGGGKVTADVLLASMVRAGLLQRRLRPLYHALQAALFEANGVTPTAAAIAALKGETPLPAAIVASIKAHRAARGCTDDDDLLCGIGELAMRLQYSPATAQAAAAAAAAEAAASRALTARLRRRGAVGPLPGSAVPDLLFRTLNFGAYLVTLHDMNVAVLASAPAPPASAPEKQPAEGDAGADAGAAAEADVSTLDAEAAVEHQRDWHVRRREPLVATFESYFRLCLMHRPGKLQALLRDMHGWTDTLFKPAADASAAAAAAPGAPPLRERFVDLILSVPPFRDVYAGESDGGGGAGFVAGMRSGELLTHHAHFSAGALAAMILPTRVLQGEQIADLAIRHPLFKRDEEEEKAEAAAAAKGIDATDEAPGDGSALAPADADPAVLAAAEEPTSPRMSWGWRTPRRSAGSVVAEMAGADVDDAAGAAETTAAAGEPAEAKRSKLSCLRCRSAKGEQRKSEAGTEAGAEGGADATPAEAPTETPAEAPPGAAAAEGEVKLSALQRIKLRLRCGAAAAVVDADADAAPVSEAPPAVAELPDAPEPLNPRQIAEIDAKLLFELVELGLYLKKSDTLDNDVLELFINMNDAKNGKAGPELHKQSVMLILDDVRRRRKVGATKEFFNMRRAARPATLTLSTINECACFARDALAMLAAQPESRGKLRSVFSYYVDRSAPAAWPSLFKGTATIAFFLKYLDRESYDQAFRAFFEDNAGSERDPLDAALFKLLITPVRNTYTAPLFKLEAATLSDAEKVEELISSIRAGGERDGETVLGILKRITAGWMQLSRQKFQVPMAPRNAQIISMLLCCEWVRRRLEKDGSIPEEQRAFITRVGTGEGKSLIIAMIAIYLVKILKKKVHVMEANEALLLRDVEEMREFYALFNISVSANFGGFLREERCDITYCCRRDLNSYYRKFVSSAPLDNTVLVLDEVDQLIVDEKPNLNYVERDAERSPQLRDYFDAFIAGKGDSLPETPEKAKALSAFKKGEELIKSGKFAKVQEPNSATGEDRDVYVELDDKGKPRKGFYFASCEYLNYKFAGVPPESKSLYFQQSMPFMMNQYEAILGLSGSLGSPSEQAFMRSTYGVRTMATPPFLNTCQAMRKRTPTLHTGAVKVVMTAEEQVVEVSRLAMEFRQRVPVVILANDTASAKKLYAACFTPQQRDAGTVQLFLELDPNTGKKTDYSAVVKEATRPRQATWSASGTVWPITVSDPFGGRGQDYTVLKEEVDDAGGIMVICTAIPDSQREWTQWLGRTARSDRRGQYAVVLLRSDSPVSALSADALKQHQIGVVPGRYRDTLVDALLAERDKGIRRVLDDLAPELAMGKRLHELCYVFWLAQKGGCNVASWPATEVQKQLRGFLERLPKWADSVAYGKANGLRTEKLEPLERLALQTKCSAATVFTREACLAFAVEAGLSKDAEAAAALLKMQ